MRKKILLSVIGLLLIGWGASAQTEREASDSAKIYFELARSEIKLDLRNNGAQFDRIFKSLEQALKEGKVEKISIAATASPDGSYEFNQKLSKARADAIVKYITSKYPLPARKIESIPGGIAWDMLRERIESSDRADKEDILRVLDEVPEVTVVNGRNVETRKNALQALNGGRTWKDLYDNVFPSLRSGVALYLYLFPVPEDQMPEYLASLAQKEKDKEVGSNQVTDQPVVEKEKELEIYDVVPSANDYESAGELIPVAETTPFFMAVKSNLLYDAALVPNVGVEFYLADNFSLSGMFHCGWWNGKHAHNWWRTLGGELEARYWFGAAAQEKPLTGHHVGLQLMAETYDFQFAGKAMKGRLEKLAEKLQNAEGFGWQSKYTYGVGVSYGYSLPIAKRLNLDFEVALGFLGGDVQRYVVNKLGPNLDGDLTVSTTMDHCTTGADSWYYKDGEREGANKFYMATPTKSANPAGKPYYFGPTKIGVTLVYLIGKTNSNGKFDK